MTKAFCFLAARLAEPTTWRGIMLCLTATGVTLRPELQSAIVAAGLAITGLLGVVIPDAAPGQAGLAEE